MTYRFDNHTYLVVLKKDEELLAELDKFVQTTKLQQATISGLGGALQVELGFYNLKTQAYQWRLVDELCEIASLQGNLARDENGKPAFHLHGVFAGENYQVLAGHVRKLIVGGTCELVIQPFGELLERRVDPETGLNLLHL
jgi:predicted DNA-binding protein with PD1-like motif